MLECWQAAVSLYLGLMSSKQAERGEPLTQNKVNNVVPHKWVDRETAN